MKLRCLDGMVNNFNKTMLEAIRCNMDIKFIGSGASAKAVLYYITDYITKSQLKAHVAYAALELAASKLGVPDPDDDDITIRAKKLLQKCAFAMISHQELSAQQVCSYLMDYGDHYTSHEYRNLYWTAFEKFINDEMPSPECYQSEIATVDEEDGNLAAASESDTHYCAQENAELNNMAEENSNDEDDVLVELLPNGILKARVTQVTDYQLRAPAFNNLCLWDAAAQLDKVRIPATKTDSKSASAPEYNAYTLHHIPI